MNRENWDLGSAGQVLGACHLASARKNIQRRGRHGRRFAPFGRSVNTHLPGFCGTLTRPSALQVTRTYPHGNCGSAGVSFMGWIPSVPSMVQEYQLNNMRAPP